MKNTGKTIRLWRLLVIALATLVLCSCRKLPTHSPGASPHDAPIPAAMSLPPSAFAGAPGDGYTTAGASPHEEPPPSGLVAPWSPPGLRGPWPADEYIHDGGDRDGDVAVDREFRVHGLDTGDTIAHFDTLDGRRIARRSNRIDIYAPRFASIVKINDVASYNDRVGVDEFQREVLPLSQEDSQFATTTLQPVQAERQISSVPPTIYRTREAVYPLAASQGHAAVQDRLLPYENFRLIANGTLEQSESAYLAKAVDAALIWTSDLAVQVTLNSQAAARVEGDQRAWATFSFGGEGKPALRIVKIASTQEARPGEFVDFTLRFDNVGGQPIGNVTIVDNLTTRLEYVPDSQKSSVPADFFTEQNDGQSLVLRWEITTPLAPGQGGVVRFRCKVR